MSLKGISVLMSVAVSLIASAAFGAGPTFRPDKFFKGSSLDGWHVLGAADWSAQNGEIVGKAKGDGGGWLVLDHPYQDLGVYASFRCGTGCETGILMRAEKTPEGMKGIFWSLSNGTMANYSVKLDSEGRIVERKPLGTARGWSLILPPPPPESEAAPSRRARRGPPRASAGPELPVKPPDGSLRPNDWNEVELIADVDVLTATVNDVRAGSGAAYSSLGRYGPMALYVGGSGEVRFKDLGYRDLGLKALPSEQVSDHFDIQRLNDFYYGWSVAAADINRDGYTDIASGPYYYLGPYYTTYREIYPRVTYSPSTEFPEDCWVEHAADFTGDGWPDVLTTTHSGGGAILYVNPGKELRRWDKYQVVSSISAEITLVEDVDGDGAPELVYAADGSLCYAKPDPSNPTGQWTVHKITEPGYATAHGLGVGDVNGDGIMDILNAFGWYEQPATRTGMWKYHPVAFGRWYRGSPGGSVMAVYDVNGNGLNDVVTSLTAHGIGLAWYEQKRDSAGNISFVQHMIMDDFTTKNAGGVTFSELHGADFADIDGDGITDFIVGKRFFSHLDTHLDPDPFDAPVLYWYRTVRDPKAPGGARFVPELIHNRSGVGSDVMATDVNKDGIVDVVTATDRGLFAFWGKR